LPTALISKTVQHTTFSLWSESPTLLFYSPFCQAKTVGKTVKERPFKAVKDVNKLPFLAPAAHAQPKAER
jgi:hypothetical protein